MIYRFGAFCLDTRVGSLFGPDGVISLRRQTFRLLEVLLDHAPELVDRNTLLDEAWGRTALSPNVLPQAISELRQCLGDHPRIPKYIETLHRRGYRMACPVERLEGDSPPSKVMHSAGAGTGPSRRGRPTPALVTASIGLLGVLMVAGFWWNQDSRQAWLHQTAIPEIRQLMETDLARAWETASRTRTRVGFDAQLEQLWLDLTLPVTLTSQPEGATLSVRGYPGTDQDWVVLGKTPLEEVRLPLTQLQIRGELEGHFPVKVAPGVLPRAEPIYLHPEAMTPGDMVYVPAGRVNYLLLEQEVPAFWIDRHEVTNRQFLRFVEDGGYQRPELWTDPAFENGRQLSHDELMTRLVDTTNMPGPATWALGTYPEGEDDHPVEGVSWYEARAYAEYVGKELPSVFHWYRAAGLNTAQVANFSGIIQASNFGNRGTVPVGSSNGLGPYGTYDMAGNVAEWCFNSSGDRHHILGGSWQSNTYQYRDPDAQSPLKRLPGFGFRLIQSTGDPNPELLADVGFPVLEVPEPVDDATFALYSRLFDYDRAELDIRVEEIDDTHQAWRRERISFTAGYPADRVIAQVFIPSGYKPPYQTVVHFPGGDALMLGDSREAGLMHIEPFLRSGRAVVFPVYQDTFERRILEELGPIGRRDVLIQRVKDVRRTIDYLETRGDIDMDRLAFHGLSFGGIMAPYVLAIENRFTTAMIMSAGLVIVRPMPPEIRMPDYLQRVTLPTLLVNGRDDFNFPHEISQQPYFELLGTPADQKQHLVLDWGHLPPRYSEVVRAFLDWSDHWLGPVERT